MKMTMKMKAALQCSFAVLLVIAWVLFPVYAGATNKPKPTTQEQEQMQKQMQTATAEAEATGGNATINIGTNGGGVEGQSSSESQGALSSNASNDGVTVEGDTSNVQNNSSNIVLVPNNNTESCLRVWGISFGKDGTAGALGIPWRSGACDFEQAADDAFAAGERDLGWFWKCKSKNLYKQFKSKGDSEEQAESKCYDRMMAGVSQAGIIHTLEERLTEIMALRETERNQFNESKERLTQMCNDSKNKILDACMKK
jgi:hypothetical protein